MNLFRRHIGRRVAGVGVAAALLVLGLEAPAFAAPPVISSFTPDSGLESGGCVVVVTGTGLDDLATATWEFVPTTTGTTVAATDYVLVSDTEAWVVAPDLVSGTAYNIKITNAISTSTSTGTFSATAGAGNCAPTITSITPNCGSSNAKVVIAGTNLLLDVVSVTPRTIAGGTVQFTPFTSNAAVVPPDSDTAIQLTRFVSSDAADGVVKVIAGGGTGFSTLPFAVPPPDCPVVGPVTHARSITLRLRGALVARGKVSSTEDPAVTECVASVPVKIQRRRAGGWRTVGSATTSETGAYSKRIRNRRGVYRSVATKVTLANGEVCSRAVSRRVRH